MTKILIVDDEYLEREMLQSTIQKRFGREADIRLAVNGRQAVDIATLWGADILLMDIEMPGLNGIEALRQILEQHSECKAIFITAYSLFSYAHEAVKLGVTDYLLKPADPDDVEQAIRRAMKQLESLKQLAAVNRDKDSVSVDAADTLMAKVLRYMRHNYMLYDICLDSVSQIVNMNASYFSSQFKKTTGVNFVDYLTELRMNAAKKLLSDPLRPTAEIANMVGYDSASYFTRVFKKHTGLTPTEYRRQQAQKKVPLV